MSSNVDNSPLPPQDETREKFEKNGAQETHAEEQKPAAEENARPAEEEAKPAEEEAAKPAEEEAAKPAEEPADQMPTGTDEETAAATKIQAMQRQRQAKKSVDVKRAEQQLPGKVTVRVVAADGLKNARSFGVIDPCARVFGGAKDDVQLLTPTLDSTVDPKWPEAQSTVQIAVADASDRIRIEVLDDGAHGTVSLGSVEVPLLATIARPAGSSAKSVTLPLGADAGTVTVELSYMQVIPEEPNAPKMNQALVFVKPHANTEATVALAKEMLAAAKVSVLTEGEVDGAAIDERRIIDKHYATIARYATEWGADRVAPSEAALAAFEAKFGQTWAAAVEAGTVLNAAQTMEKLGGISAEDMTAKWAAAADKVKLAPGLYVGKLAAEDGATYVLNGFYPGNRAKFTRADAVVRWFTVEWDEAALTWADFRGKVIGPTNPEAAPEGSIRGTILARWEGLGLAGAPNVSDNGVHASAGPLEGIAERGVWLGTKLEDDPTALAAIAAGASVAALQEAVGNPVVTLEERTEPIFDILEDRQTSEVLPLLVEHSGVVAAATKIQAMQRMRQGKAAAAKKRAAKAEEPAAADDAEKAADDGKDGADVSGEESSNKHQDPEDATAAAQDAAATKIQSVQRQRQARAVVEERRKLLAEQNTTEGDAAAVPDSTEIVPYDDADEEEDVPYTPPRTYVSRPRKRLDDARSQAIELMGMRPTSDEYELRKFFEVLDSNGSGSLDRDEFKAIYLAMEDFGAAPSPRQIDRLFAKYDKQKDGRLDFHEFCLLMIHRVNM